MATQHDQDQSELNDKREAAIESLLSREELESMDAEELFGADRLHDMMDAEIAVALEAYEEYLRSEATDEELGLAADE